ncbi:HAD family hydrolase [Streptomyces sp. NPDC096324]|uniref:HAD family hydrolase n=1 Tax=Streptomyces sp. NPDC096324 TaxID=3366085 RepID=UPI00381CE341
MVRALQRRAWLRRLGEEEKRLIAERAAPAPDGGQAPIASGGARRAVHASLDTTALRPLFEVIVTSEDAARGKPDPGLFLYAATRLGVTPARCLVYEDSPEGIPAAQAAGMHVVDVQCFREDQRP